MYVCMRGGFENAFLPREVVASCVDPGFAPLAAILLRAQVATSSTSTTLTLQRRHFLGSWQRGFFKSERLGTF